MNNVKKEKKKKKAFAVVLTAANVIIMKYFQEEKKNCKNTMISFHSSHNRYKQCKEISHSAVQVG